MDRKRIGAALLLALVACTSSGSSDGEAKPASGGPTAAPATKLPPGLPGQPEADLKEAVAVIDGQTISVAEFQERINKQSPYVRARYTSQEQKKEFLDTLVRFEVLAKEAKKRGYDQDSEVVRTMKQVMIQKLLKDEFESKLKPEDIPEEELKKFYDSHTSDYNKPEEIRVSAIVLKEKDKAKKAHDEAKAPANADNKAFRDLVTKYSEDEDSKARGGDLRFFAIDAKPETIKVPAEVIKAAFELKNQGDVSAPIAADGKFYVLKQTGLRKAINKPYDEVKRQIQNRLYRDKRNEAMETFVAELKKSAKIDIKADALAKVRIDTTQPTAPGGEMGEPGAAPGVIHVGAPGSPIAVPPSAPTPAANPKQP